ncbi:hypothetical protein [Alteraurantiacibacter palmitatis]|uniref:Uncharacterized protein n=1 Tax=Alteraurantiacibacter palmitatis TaxID=2054628 RepID=A0ABV7E6M8_9SPHN
MATAPPRPANPASPNTTSLRWAALSDAGAVVAALAGAEPEAPDLRLRNFPLLIRECPAWQRQLALDAVEDLAAVMEQGIAALLAINARGADPRPAARALWAEFHAARTAMLALLPQTGGMGPLRSA